MAAAKQRHAVTMAAARRHAANTPEERQRTATVLFAPTEKFTAMAQPAPLPGDPARHTPHLVEPQRPAQQRRTRPLHTLPQPAVPGPPMPEAAVNTNRNC